MLTAFPSTATCILAAFLHGGPDLEHHDLLPISFPSESCQVDAWVSDGNLQIEGASFRVIIPVPSNNEWYLFKYRWGFDLAYLTKMGEKDWRPVPVRMGPVGYY